MCVSFLYLFVFKHVYFWLPYASAAVANSVTVFVRYFCGDHLPSHAIDLSCASGGHSYHNYGKPTHLLTFTVFLRLQLCILYYSMCFSSLLYDTLWLGRDPLWPEQLNLWLWLGRDALWTQQFIKASTPLPASCTMQTRRPEVATRHETTCMVAIRWKWSSRQTRQSA